jgi:uncharacterized membrane protein YjjB (DUF3815 family)
MRHHHGIAAMMTGRFGSIIFMYIGSPPAFNRSASFSASFVIGCPATVRADATAFPSRTVSRIAAIASSKETPHMAL